MPPLWAAWASLLGLTGSANLKTRLGVQIQSWLILTKFRNRRKFYKLLASRRAGSLAEQAIAAHRLDGDEKPSGNVRPSGAGRGSHRVQLACGSECGARRSPLRALLSKKE